MARLEGDTLTESVDQVVFFFTKTMLVSDFKARCIATLKEVQRTREPVLVTLHGKPLARVLPPDATATQKGLGGIWFPSHSSGTFLPPAIPI